MKPLSIKVERQSPPPPPLLSSQHHLQPPHQSQQQPPQHNNNPFGHPTTAILPSIHNLTQHGSSQQQQDGDYYNHHYSSQQQQQPLYHLRTHGEKAPPGHDLMEALVSKQQPSQPQQQQVLRYAPPPPPHYQAIVQHDIEIVPMDSFIPGYISGYRKTPTTVSNEMQPNTPSIGGLVATSSASPQLMTTPVKISTSSSGKPATSTQQLNATPSATTQQQPPCQATPVSSSSDSQAARMACMNCRKSHRKCDKGMPCGECKKRGIPDECVYYEPKKRGPKMKTAEEEAQSKEESKKRKLNKKNDANNNNTATNINNNAIATTPVFPTTTTTATNSASNSIAVNNHNSSGLFNATHSAFTTAAELDKATSLSSLLLLSQQQQQLNNSIPTTTTTTPTIFSRKEIDRRNYILHMIFPQANLPNETTRNFPDDSFNEMFRLFYSDEFVSFLVECLDGGKSRDVLIPFVRDRVLVWILDRIMEPYYHGMYFSLEALFLKYYCLFKLSPQDDNRPILLLESDKSVKQSKKEFNLITNDIQAVICNLWSSFFNTILEFKSVNASYNQLIIKNMLEQIVNKLSLPETADLRDVLELQHVLFTRFLLLIEIHQQIEGCTTNSVQFKKLVFNFLKLTYLSGFTSKSTKLVDQFEKFNTKFFSILTSQYSSMSLNVNYVLSEMECFTPRNLTECLTFLSVITPSEAGEQDLNVLFLEYMSKLLNLSIYMQGILDTDEINLQEINTSVVKDFFNMVKNLKSPIILSILNSLQNYLISAFFSNTISIPETAQLEHQFRECILTSVTQFEYQDHFYFRASHTLIRGKDLTEVWKESKKVYIK